MVKKTLTRRNVQVLRALACKRIPSFSAKSFADSAKASLISLLRAAGKFAGDQ